MSDTLFRWTGEFASPERERAFLDFDWPKTAMMLRRMAAIATGVVTFIWISVSLYNGVRWGSAPFWLGTLAILLVVNALSRRAASPALLPWVIMALELCTIAMLTVDFYLASELPDYRSPPVQLGLYWVLFLTFLPGRLTLSIGACLATFAFDIAWELSRPAPNHHWLLDFSFVGVLVVAFSISYLRVVNRNKRRDYLNQVALERARVEAEAANSAKSRFLATMSHEMRTPLAGAMSGMELMRVERSPIRREHLQSQVQACHARLKRSIEDVLDIASVEAGKLHLLPVAVDLRALLEHVRWLLADSARARSLAFELTLGDGLPDWVQVDPDRLQQVLLNLGGNAVKYTDRGSVTLAVEAAPAGEGRVACGFRFRDTGIGIAPEVSARIFEPFFQVDDTLRGRRGGIGIGLSLCKEIARVMGGTLTLESAAGEGTQVTLELTLPIAQEPVAESDLESHKPLPSPILLVDDNEVTLATTRAILERHSVGVIAAASGEAALRSLTGGMRPVLALMDLHLPDTDGVVLTRQLHALQGYETLPVLAFTADATSEQVAQCREAGMRGFLVKPVGTASLLRALRQVGKGVPWIEQLRESPTALTYSAIDPERLCEIAATMSANEMARLFQMLRTSVEKLLLDLEGYAARGDEAALSKAAHTLKGVAATGGMTRMNLLAAELERPAEEHRLALLAEAREVATASFAELEKHQGQVA